MKKNTRGLGKGLGALLSESEQAIVETQASSAVLMDVDIDQIVPNPNQARKVFDEEGLKALAASIRLYGVVQPILLRKLPEGEYMLIAGERRWRAARIAGLSKMPAILCALDDRAQTEISLIENLQRQNLNPIEEAMGINFLMEEYELTQQQVAERLSRSRPAITNALRLLQLPRTVQKLVADGSLSAGHARALVTLDNPELQMKVAERIIQEGLSVRQTETLLKALTQTQVTTHKRAELDMPVELVELENRLSRRFGTKVRIKGNLMKGRIELDYYSDEDLQRLYEALGLEE